MVEWTNRGCKYHGKIGRFVVNDNRKRKQKRVYVFNLLRQNFDHSSIVVRWGDDVEAVRRMKKKIQFEKFWVSREDYEGVIKEGWIRDDGLENISMKLNKCATRLENWNRLTFGNVGRKIRDLNSQLEKLQN